MGILNKLKLGYLIAVIAVPLLPTSVVLAGEEQRAPPEARTAGTLSEPVMRAISSIQELMSPEDPNDQPDLARAKEELDELRARRFERMNDFEKSTLLSFYTNYYLGIEDYLGAIRTFEEILDIEELRQDQRLRTLRSLGQLYAAEENWQASIDNYTTWRELSLTEDEIVFKGLSYAHYQLEQFDQALPYWLDYMRMALGAGTELPRTDYAYLSGLYFVLEDFDSALDLIKTMIVKFDDQTDWQNLSAVYASLDQESRRIQSLNLAYLKGLLDDDAEFLNLSQSLAGQDIPMSGIPVFEAGVEGGFVEMDVDNLEIYTQMYLIASDYARAEGPARQLAEADPTGNGYDTLGYIQYVLHKYGDAAESFQNALDKGELDNRADTLLFLARSLVELNEFDAAREAARDSAEAGDENDQEAANSYISFINDSQSRFNILAERRNDAIDFYQPYPPLQ